MRYNYILCYSYGENIGKMLVVISKLPAELDQIVFKDHPDLIPCVVIN